MLCTTRFFIRNSLKNRRMQRAGIHGRTEGATADSKDFGEKEKAAENRWARQAEADKLKALKAAIEEQKKATDALKKELDSITGKQQQ